MFTEVYLTFWYALEHPPWVLSCSNTMSLFYPLYQIMRSRKIKYVNDLCTFQPYLKCKELLTDHRFFLNISSIFFHFSFQWCSFQLFSPKRFSLIFTHWPQRVSSSVKLSQRKMKLYWNIFHFWVLTSDW